MKKMPVPQPFDEYGVVRNDIGESCLLTLDVRVVAGSNPATPTKQKPYSVGVFQVAAFVSLVTSADCAQFCGAPGKLGKGGWEDDLT